MMTHQFTKAQYTPAKQWVREIESRSFVGTTPYGWCAGSLQTAQGNRCHVCDQDMHTVPKRTSVGNQRLSPHMRVSVKKWALTY